MATAAVELPSHQRVTPGSVNLPAAQWPPTITSEPKDPDAIASDIIKAFNAALDNDDTLAIANLFHTDSYWRDHLALSWNYHTWKGQDAIKDFLKDGCQLKHVDVDKSSTFRSPHVSPLDQRGEVKGLEFFITFETKQGNGQGVCRLVEVNEKWKIFSLYTCLRNLTGHEEATLSRRPVGVEHGGKPDRKNWVERRSAESNYEEGREPTVVIVGAGQGGLTVAARLKTLGIDALIVDMNKRVGDNWRNRYHQLVLHDPVWYDHLPYMPFPENWPIFTPKDKLGDWFESYVQVMELNVWMQTTLTKSSWDASSRTWTVTLDRKDPKSGETTTRVFHPHHVIQATGHSGKKNFPKIQGMENFKGTKLCHSSEFPGATPNSKGKKAIVVGCCNSGHDISQSFYENGYDVTMIQRSTTCVVSSESITDIALGGLYDENGPPVDDADLWLHGVPSAVLKAIQIQVAAVQAKHDAKTLEGLEKAGFKLDRGPDMGGMFIKYFQRGGGYYIDVGASQLIIDGKIKIKQGHGIKEVLEHGLKFDDDSELEADEIVFATGYQNMRTEARTIFGDEVADKVHDIWGFDEEGEMRTIWRPTGHPNFWFMGGNLALCRYYSKLLALQILAREVGLVKD